MSCCISSVLYIYNKKNPLTFNFLFHVFEWFDLFQTLNITTLDIPHLLPSEQLSAHHLDLDRNQSEGLKCQTASVSVVVLNTNR